MKSSLVLLGASLLFLLCSLLSCVDDSVVSGSPEKSS